MKQTQLPSEQYPMTKTCPEGRLSDSTKFVNGRRVVDLQTYIPHLLSSVNNALSRGASQLYLDRFGVGIVEWRIISMLAIEPNIPASAICEEISIDKGAASRALARLYEVGLVSFETTIPDVRKKDWFLNERGYQLHDQILAIALGRERQLIEGIDPDDLEAFLRTMRMMRVNVRRMK